MEYYLFTTKHCNLNCTYCSGVNIIRKEPIDDSPKDIKGIIEFIKNNNQGEKDTVIFYGGEPFLNQEFIKEFLKKAACLNIEFGINTNGTLLGKVDRFIIERLGILQLSIDGIKEVHDAQRGNGSFEKAMANYLKIKPLFKGVSLARMTLTPKNSVLFAIAGLQNFDYVYWQIENCREISKDFTKRYSQEIDILLDWWITHLNEGIMKGIVPFQIIVDALLFDKKALSYRCGFGSFLIAINVDGACYACDDLIYPEFRLGDVYHGIKKKKFISANQIKHCLGCEIKEICGGRCFKESLSDEKIFLNYCELTKILVNKIKTKLPEIKEAFEKAGFSKKDLVNPCSVEEIP